MKFYPYKKGDGKSFRHAEGGEDTTRFWVLLARELAFLGILEGERKTLPPFKKKAGGGHVLAMLKGGGTTSFGVLLAQELEVLGVLEGERKTLPPF